MSSQTPTELPEWYLRIKKAKGSKVQVFHQNAKRTSGGLAKWNLMENAHKQIVSKRKHAAGLKSGVQNLGQYLHARKYLSPPRAAVTRSRSQGAVMRSQKKKSRKHVKKARKQAKSQKKNAAGRTPMGALRRSTRLAGLRFF